MAFADLSDAQREDMVVSLAALALADGGVETSADNINALIAASGNKVQAFWAGLYSKLLAEKDINELIVKPGGGGGGGGGGEGKHKESDGKRKESAGSESSEGKHGADSVIFHERFGGKGGSDGGDVAAAAARWLPGPVDDDKIAACFRGGYRGVVAMDALPPDVAGRVRDAGGDGAAHRRDRFPGDGHGLGVLALQKSVAPRQPYNLGGAYRRVPKGSQPRRLAFSILVTRNDRRTGHVALGSRPRVSAVAAWFILRANGRMGLFAGDHVGYIEVGSYVPFVWYRVEILLDWTARVCQLYIDGKLRTDDVPFVGDMVKDVRMLMFDTVDASTCCLIDDVLLES